MTKGLLENIPSSITIIGTLAVAVYAQAEGVGNVWLWAIVAATYLLSVFSWVFTDSKSAKRSNELSLIKMGLENEKLRIETARLDMATKFIGKMMEEPKK